MRKISLGARLLGLVGLAQVSCAPVQQTSHKAEQAKAVPQAPQALLSEAFTSNPVAFSPDDYEWVMQPHGAEMALVWGDPETGPSAFMVKYPPNWGGPVNLPPDAPAKLHMHTYGYHNVIISGGGKHWHEGQTEDDAVFLSAGSYFYQPGGQYHSETFRTDEPTYLFAYFEGPRDTYIDGVKVYPLDP